MLGGLYFISVFLYRKFYLNLKKKREALREELAPVISNFLFHTNEDPVNEQKEYIKLKIAIREKLRYPEFRKTLGEILYDLQKDVSGEVRERLLILYRELELHHHSLERLNSWRWEVVSKGIRELTEMEVEETFLLIAKKINHRLAVVRRQAELATVKLSPKGINKILDTAKYPISEWQQLKIIEALGTIENFEPPRFKSWLLSPNNDVVLFALRLMRHYNQNDAETAIIELVKHKEDIIKKEALECIKYFGFTRNLSSLKQIFSGLSNGVKIEVLNVFGELGTDADLPFLYHIKGIEQEYFVHSKVLATINLILPDSELPTSDIEKFKSELPKNLEEVTVKGDDEEIYNFVEWSKSITPTKETPIETEDVTDDMASSVSELDEETSDTLDEHLGLVSTSENDNTAVQPKSFEDNYSNLDLDSREKLLDSIEDFGDSREQEHLEVIVEKEENSELRFRAFHILKRLQDFKNRVNSNDVEKKASEEEESFNANEEGFLHESMHSIFYRLFQKAADDNAKKILLVEMQPVGDEKEIPFLKRLLRTEAKTLHSTVKETLSIIEKRLDYEKDEPKIEEEHSPAKEPSANENRISLEMFSLYEEIGISPAQDTLDFEPDFELSGTIAERIEPKNPKDV